MARYEIATLETAATGQGNSAGDIFFQLGIMFSAGSAAAIDRIAAHKWFNLAAEMSDQEIASAQSAAREWLTTH